jgi:type II secretory pathway component GspD/PulD (secretin)
VLTKPTELCAFDGKPYAFDDFRWVTNTVPRIAIKRTQQGNELLIMVISDKPVPIAHPELDNVRTELQISGTRDKLMLHALNADITDVMEKLSALTGDTIYLSNDLQRKMTVHLENISIEQALKAITKGYALALGNRDNAYYLSPGLGGSAAGIWSTMTRSIPLQYLAPSTARGLLPDSLLPYLSPNRDGHAITVSGAPDIIDKIEQDLRAIDQPAYHCLLRAWIISGEVSARQIREAIAAVTVDHTEVGLDSGGDISIARSSALPEEVLLKLRALNNQKTMSVESVPVIQAENGQYANLFAGKNIYYWRISPEIRLTNVEAGTRLRMTPRTSGEWITLDYRAEDKFLREQNELGPLILRSTVNGTIRIHSGDIIVVGGLHLDLQDNINGKLTRKHGRIARHMDNATQEFWVLLQATATLDPVGNEALERRAL